MMRLLSVLETEYDNLKRLVVKVWNGKSITKTAEEYGPFGVDSRPVKGTVAIYTETSKDGDEAIIGHQNRERKAEIGETRFYCTDENGAFKFNLWLRADGTALIGESAEPGDYTNFAVKFNELKEEYDKLKKTVNDLITAYNAHIHITTATVGLGPALGVIAATTSTAQPDTSSIDNCKHEKLKYKG